MEEGSDVMEPWWSVRQDGLVDGGSQVSSGVARGALLGTAGSVCTVNIVFFRIDFGARELDRLSSVVVVGLKVTLRMCLRGVGLRRSAQGRWTTSSSDEDESEDKDEEVEVR